MKSDEELVSIIMPIKNAEEWLDECLNSILNQSYQSWELVAINDHSSDQTQQILEHFAKKDARISCNLNAGQGIIDALQTALTMCKGEWVTRMDADDIMPKEKLENLVNTLQNDKKAIATGMVKYFSDTTISEGYLSYENWLNERCVKHDHWKWIYRECVLASANWLTHINNVILEGDTYPEDYRLVFDWYEKNLSVKCSASITHLWREHPARTSRNSENYQQDAFFNLKIKQFIALDYDSKCPLILFGNNQKSSITKNILAALGIDFHHITLENITELQNHIRPQILVAVYPKSSERNKIEEDFESQQLKNGRDWWWL